jgi:hypothetical protein
MWLSHQCLLKHCDYRWRQSGKPFPQVTEIPGCGVGEDSCRCRPAPYRRAGQGPQGDRAEHEDIAARPWNETARDGGVDVLRRTANGTGVADDPCHTKIAQHRQPDRREQDVPGRDIPMQHATLMRVGQRGADWRQRRDDFANGEPAAPREHVGERSTVGEVEHQDGGVRRGNQSVQANQVRVIQGGQQCRLGSRRAQRVRLSQRDPFEGYPLARRGDAGSPHLAGVTRSEQLTDDEPGELPRCTAHGHAG